MRVLCVGNRYPPWSMGGYEIIFTRAVAALREEGHAVSVLTTRPDPTDLAADPTPDPTGTPPHTRDRPTPGPVSEPVLRDLRWYWRAHEFPPLGLRATATLERTNAATLQSRLQSDRPHVLVWWAMGGMSLSLLEQGRRAGIPAVGVVCDDWMLYGPRVDGWSNRWCWLRRLGALGLLGARALERGVGVPALLNLDEAAQWLFISEYARSAARGSGWPLPGARVAHAGVDLERFGQRAPEPWGGRLLYCGRVDPRKGIATAVRALTHLPEGVTLTIHGSGEKAHATQLAALAAELGVTDRVRLQHSSHEEVPGVYAAADAIVFPVTWREPWGLVPLEAMAIGRPVLASRAGGGAAEYLADGENCLQFDPGDALGLAGCVNRLAIEADLRDGLRAGGRRTAERFSERAFHDTLAQTLRDTVESSRAS